MAAFYGQAVGLKTHIWANNTRSILLLAGFLGRQLGWYEPGEGVGIIGAMLGAILILFLYRAFKGRAAV